ncbi:MAG: ATP-binding protein [Fulvivirga sp.]
MKLQKNFRLNILIRILMISGLSLLLAWVLVSTNWFFTPLVVGVVLILVVINLIFYVERTNKNLSQFLLSIKQGGFTNLFKDSAHGGTHGGLNEVFNEVMIQFQKVTLEKESHYQYLQTLTENLGVSLLSFDDDGHIELMNPAAKSLLKKPYLKNISDVKHINNELYEAVTLLDSEEKRVIKTVLSGELLQVSVQVKDFVAQEKHFRLVLIHNIHNELEEKEVEAWQKLISVLTHEIMNSVTPIVSLSTAMNQQLQHQELNMSNDDAEDLKLSLATIENRSKGLMRFVNAYKDFTKKPDINVSDIDLKQLVDRVVHLLSPDLQNAKIKTTIHVSDAHFNIKGDPELIEQVIINLLKNAIEVLDGRESAKVDLMLEKKGRKCAITISDNGPGMERESLEKIFVPFFTTKKKGTGIGLSFARQIMRLHSGSISARSNLGEGTSFVLEF